MRRCVWSRNPQEWGGHDPRWVAAPQQKKNVQIMFLFDVKLCGMLDPSLLSWRRQRGSFETLAPVYETARPYAPGTHNLKLSVWRIFVELHWNTKRLLTLLLGILEVSVLYLRLETFCPNRTSVVLLSPPPGSFQDGIAVPSRIFLLNLSSIMLVFHAFMWNSACLSVMHKGMAGNIICRLMNLDCIHVSITHLYVKQSH